MRSGTILVLMLLFTLVVSAGIGSVPLSTARVIAALRRGPSATDPDSVTLWQSRLPRIFLSALIGASLAAAGVAFQSLLRNDLADPYIIGVSSGASVGSEAILIAHGETWLAGVALPLTALLSAMAAMATVYALARRGGRVAVTSLLLAGVVISAFLGGISTLLLLLDPNAQGDTQRILGRLMGSLADSTFAQSAVQSVFLAVGTVILFAQSRAMNLFALGEESAQQLGVETERFKTTLIVTGSLLTAAAVAAAGIIGFVGLIVPHLARRLAGTPDARRVLPLALLGGAILLVWADTLARSIMGDGRELPVGVITAFLGAPYFLFLLRRAQRVS